MQAQEALAAAFWRWRTTQQPRSGDDIPRRDRPPGWVPRWSAEAVAQMREQLSAFRSSLAALPATEERADQVDRRLLLSALNRVTWELDVDPAWRTNPTFYVDQTVGAVFDLLAPPRVDETRLRSLACLFESFPRTIAEARENLVACPAEFAEQALGQLQRIEDDLTAVVRALGQDCGAFPAYQQVVRALPSAITALTQYRAWLPQAAANSPARRPVGVERFQWFLARVALVPLTPAEIDTIGAREFDRAVALESTYRAVHRSLDPAATTNLPRCRFETAEEQSVAQRQAEADIRAFYGERNLLTIPADLPPYYTTLIPDYLAPIAWAGTADDLTSEERCGQEGIAYFPAPRAGMPYFYAANAYDPRAGIIHEGVHHRQLTMSWRHPRRTRRHYYDSTPNEGIAFYNEELMLAAGLFDDDPGTCEIVANFIRLRALRARVDVGLASGRLDLAGAADLLRTRVPVDSETAHHEAAFFAATPGQALTYQIGKSEILRLLSDARSAAEDFDLRAFHDRLWLEGNVPLSLQRWELLDDDSDLRRLEELSPADPPRG